MGALVSILIPCFNAERYVAAAVQSAIDQTWPDKEVIVVNDGSTDRSGDILDSFKQAGVRVIHQRCGGASAARNLAFRESRGDYIKFFDADDLLDRQTLELQMRRLAGSESAVATCSWGRFYDDDLSTFRLNPQTVWRDMRSIDWLVEACMDARPMMQPGLFLIPRSVLTCSGPWNGGLSLIDDFEFFARVLCHAREVRFAPGGRLYYRSGINGSLSGRKSRKAMESAFLSLTLGTSHLLERRSDPAARIACANVLQEFIFSCYPEHGDLRRKVEARIHDLGGSRIEPDGPPRFQTLRRFVGWKVARRIQRYVTARRSHVPCP